MSPMLIDMLTEEDFEKLWFLYKLEGEPRNLSIEAFCESQGIQPSVFTKWLKIRQKKIVRVHVDGVPSSDVPVSQSEPSPAREPHSPAAVKSVQVVLYGGMLVSKRNLSYQGLKELVEKLEVLC